LELLAVFGALNSFRSSKKLLKHSPISSYYKAWKSSSVLSFIGGITTSSVILYIIDQ